MELPAEGGAGRTQRWGTSHPWLPPQQARGKHRNEANEAREGTCPSVNSSQSPRPGDQSCPD